MSNRGSDEQGSSSPISRVFNYYRSRQGPRHPHIAAPAPAPPPPQPLSRWSSPRIPDFGYCAQDFMLGVGMIIIQEITQKVVVVYEKEKEYYFFPRGRKDKGETLEQAALREAYEESGYRAEFMPHYGENRAPTPPVDRDIGFPPNTEAVYMTSTYWPTKTRRRGNQTWVDTAGEYFIHWYLGQIPEDMVPEMGTGMPDEVNYEAHLMSYEAAIPLLPPTERRVLHYAWNVYQQTLVFRARIDQYHADKEAMTTAEQTGVDDRLESSTTRDVRQ